MKILTYYNVYKNGELFRNYIPSREEAQKIIKELIEFFEAVNYERKKYIRDTYAIEEVTI